MQQLTFLRRLVIKSEVSTSLTGAYRKNSISFAFIFDIDEKYPHLKNSKKIDFATDKKKQCGFLTFCVLEISSNLFLFVV